jgi:hypothetical protein
MPINCHALLPTIAAIAHKLFAARRSAEQSPNESRTWNFPPPKEFSVAP